MLHHGRQVRAPVESIGKLRQIPRAVLRAVKRMVSPAQGRFQVAQHRVDPLELKHLGGLPAATGHMARVSGATLQDLIEASRAVGNHVGACSRAVLVHAYIATLVPPAIGVKRMNRGLAWSFVRIAGTTADLSNAPGPQRI